MNIHKMNRRHLGNLGPGKYEDGGGLRLVVSPTGSKSWIFRFTWQGKRKEMGLGSFLDVDLKEAREKTLSYREQVQQGFNPIEIRTSEPEDNDVPTLTACAARYIRSHRKSWKSLKHAYQWIRTFQTYVRPLIGSKPVNHIATQDVLAVLLHGNFWHNKTETAKRVQGRIETILDYASAHGHREGMNPARWRGHLDKLLPKPSKIKTIIHHPSMPYEDVSSFMGELQQKNTVASRALKFLILTATRTSEVLKARWEEIDLEKALWTIPALRMKGGREHRVPLSPQALDLLEKQGPQRGYVFSGMRYGQPLSPMMLLKVMRDLDYGVEGTRGSYVPYGFRSSFRDWSGEVSSFPRDVAEMALAHSIENKVEAAYRRGDLFEKRRTMMQAWAHYIGPEFNIELSTYNPDGQRA